MTREKTYLENLCKVKYLIRKMEMTPTNIC